MDIKALRQYIANKNTKKKVIAETAAPAPTPITEPVVETTTLTESQDYVVVKSMVILDSEYYPLSKKTVKYPNAGQTAVLLKFRDGTITTGVGKNKDEAIQKAVDSKKSLFGESVQLTEAERYKILHDTLHSAIQTALAATRKMGYDISDEEEFNKITTSYKNLSTGKTEQFHLELVKGGKPQRKLLHIQVYKMDSGKYELNFYVN